MDKGIGFSRTVTLDWLDAVASMCVQNLDAHSIRQRMADVIADQVTGSESQRKTIDVLIAIWVKTQKNVPAIRAEALKMYPQLGTPTERAWLHYGMSLVCYPIFRKCVAAIGQTSRVQATITRNVIKERISADFGHLGGLDRSIERIMASLVNWGALAGTDQNSNYKIVQRVFASSESVQAWLLTCTLFAHPSSGMPIGDLLHLPELYPFIFTINTNALYKDARFEIQRQGGGIDIIRIKTG